MSGPTKVVKTKLFIGNLDPATQTPELNELFSPFGTVLEAAVIKDYAFVHFGTVEEAEKAALALNNKEFHGKRLRVELSTSTVRHRPGQPEPASALRNSRARTGGMMNVPGSSRYSPAIPVSGVGPMRHSSSSWARHDSRPYDGIPMDRAAINPGYGTLMPSYDRSRPYDVRSDARNYYADRRDNGYGSAYDGNTPGQTGMYPIRDHYDLPSHSRDDGMNYGSSRMYDRNQGTPPSDPYYSSGLLQDPSRTADPYTSHDPYQKYYANQPRSQEYPAAVDQNPPHRNEYDLYNMSRNDPPMPYQQRSSTSYYGAQHRT